MDTSFESAPDGSGAGPHQRPDGPGVVPQLLHAGRLRSSPTAASRWAPPSARPWPSPGIRTWPSPPPWPPGCSSGLITVLQTKMGVNSLLPVLSSIRGLYSINIAIMGELRPSSIWIDGRRLHKDEGPVGGHGLGRAVLKLVVAAIAVILVAVLLGLFLKTKLGLAIRATGNDPDMVRSWSINPVFTTIVGLCVANAFTGLSGCLLAQSQKSVNLDIGSGMVTIALASLLIGAAFLGRRRMGWRIVGMVPGRIRLPPGLCHRPAV
ncbi:MAG: hypothetical protein V8S89_00110 [Oscillospiraceae bacterium]